VKGFGSNQLLDVKGIGSNHLGWLTRWLEFTGPGPKNFELVGK
jgi:hypothetical protein